MFLDREACAYSVDPDQMSRNTLCNQGLHGSTLTPGDGAWCLDVGSPHVLRLCRLGVIEMY